MVTQILRDAWHYSRRTRKWWLLVILAALMGITWMMIGAEATLLGPYLYPLF
jgi:hypothetical protein